jgi:NADPH2:quinone reductase
MPFAPEEGSVSIDVEVAGVTYADMLIMSGGYQVKRPTPFVPGAEVVGIVSQAPAGGHVAPGDRVVALTPEGGWQERVSVPASAVFAVPDGLSAPAASSLLTNHVSAHFALVTRGLAASGETLLVHGAAGGVGSAAIELGDALGMTTIAVVSTQEKADFAVGLGADHVVRQDQWRADVIALVGQERGVDVVLDPVGGDRLTDSLRTLRAGGRHLVLGFTAGEIPEVKVNRLLLNNLSLIGVATGPYMDSHPGELERQWAGVSALLHARGRSPAEATLVPFHDFKEALNQVAGRRAVGKVALSLS